MGYLLEVGSQFLHRRGCLESVLAVNSGFSPDAVSFGSLTKILTFASWLVLLGIPYIDRGMLAAAVENRDFQVGTHFTLKLTHEVRCAVEDR